MTKHLCSKNEKGIRTNQGIIVGDEYTRQFRSTYTKDYLSDTMEFLSNLYDGYVEKTGTIKRGLEYVPSAYVNMISYTTFYI